MSKSIFPPWHFARWHAVDDRVRGGASQSYLEKVELPSLSGSGEGKNGARFWGTLDIDTLGGAGFASQRFTFGPKPLELPRTTYRGISLTALSESSSTSSVSSNSSDLSKPHAHTFTLVLKTSPSRASRPPSHPKIPPSPEPASLSYETSFTPSSHQSTTSISPSEKGRTSEVAFDFDFDDFRPTYRGREVPREDPKYQPLHSETIYELSLMCRSSFGDQKGEFSLIVLDIAGLPKHKDDRGKKSALWSIWTSVTAMVAGLVAWATGWFRSAGHVRLTDEEKDSLLR